MTVCGLLIAALLFGTGVHSCSIADGGERETLEVRASQPQWVVYGTVLTDEMPAPGGIGSIPENMTYTLKPKCWLKHDFPSESNFTFANITVVKQDIDCVTAALLEEGDECIIFLADVYGRFIVVDVNLQSGVIDEPTDQDFGAVYRGIEAGMDGLQDGRCQEGVDIPCFVGDIHEKVCSQSLGDNGVVVNKAAMLSVVMMSLFSAIMTF